jgi:dTDP-4-amino-4,6-dideoxygalactose transaminase/predicted dehydrogenase
MSIGKKIAGRGLRVAKNLAKKVIRFVPPPAARLSGRLARDGGLPVRDLRFRPWPTSPSESLRDWLLSVGPLMRRIFLTGAEGLPQTLGKEFSERWAEYCGVRHALLLPHGTDALRFALAATLDHDGLDYGGEVIVPNLTFIASANAALDRRFGIALVDVDPQTLNLDPARVEEAIIPGKTRAIMPVHLFGQPADMARLREIARRHSLALIEDAAQAHGAIHELGKAGGLGDAAAFSFQSSKNMSSGEGGVLTTNDPAIYERAHRLHNVGRAMLTPQRWTHESLGWNCRPSEYVAAVLLHRLARLEKEQAHRHRQFLALREQLAAIPCVQPLATGPGVVRHGAYMVVMRYKPEECGGLSVEDFLSVLHAEGIPAYRSYDMTVAQQPPIRRLAEKHPEYVRILPTPVADAAIANTLFLPHTVLLGTTGDMAEVAAAFRKVQAHYGRATPFVPQAVTVPQPAVHPSAPHVNGNGKAAGLRFGVIGLGAMGAQHLAAIARRQGATVTAVADVQAERARDEAARRGCRGFASPEELLGSGAVDAVVIATPHWQHAPLTRAALDAGLHVICEKPLAVTTAEADDVLQAAAGAAGTLAVVHQTRFDPAYRHVKNLLVSGELGPLYRCSMVESMWRTQRYYSDSPWRGTWKGEGGGVLLNQAPHLLDRYVWLCGMPESVVARCDTNLHRIEVENTVSAICRHAGGAHGHIHVTTVECPRIAQAVFSCDRGRIILEEGCLRVTRLRDSIRERTLHDAQPMGQIGSETYEVPFAEPSLPQELDAFYDNFLAAVRGDAALACPAEEARQAVELANAILLAGKTGASVRFPLDRRAYAAFLQERIAGSAETSVPV